MQATVTDKVSTAEIVSTFQSDVWRFLRVLGCDPATADDLTQDVFVEVLSRPFEIRSEVQTRAYLRRVAKSRFLSSKRTRKVTVRGASPEELEAAWVSASEPEGGEEYLAALRVCLSALDERSRMGIDAYYGSMAGSESGAGTGAEEAAKRLGMSASNLTTMLHRARTLLRACIQKRLGIESLRKSLKNGESRNGESQ